MSLGTKATTMAYCITAVAFRLRKDRRQIDGDIALVTIAFIQ